MTESEIMERLQRGQSIFEQALLALINDKNLIIDNQDLTMNRLRATIRAQEELLQDLTKVKL